MNEVNCELDLPFRPMNLIVGESIKRMRRSFNYFPLFLAGGCFDSNCLCLQRSRIMQMRMETGETNYQLKLKLKQIP